MAKAQAAAFQAINMLSTPDGKLDMDFKDLNLETPPTRVIKIMNLVDPVQARIFTEREFKKILDDIIYETAKHVDVDRIFVIKNHNSTIGAEPGSVFIVTKNKDDSLLVG